jgi:hypothetical protein
MPEARCGTTMARIPVDNSADEMPDKVFRCTQLWLRGSDRKSTASDSAALREFLAPGGGGAF